MEVKNPTKFAAFFSGINKRISMDKFEDKLEVQKIIYIGQENGIDLGYNFEWDLRGPYCQQVSGDAHEVLDSKIKSTLSEAGLDEHRVSELGKILQPYINDSEWLEIAGSLLYLRKEYYPERKIEEIIGYLLEDLTYGYKNFSESLVRRILVEMMRIGLIK